MMKKIAFCLLVFSGIFQLSAQVQNDLTGNWEGTLHAGVNLRMIFHFSRDAQGQWIGSADSPDQEANGFPCKNIVVKNDSITLEIPSVSGRFGGRILSDSAIQGQWMQGGGTFDLRLRKTNKIAEALKRPQTPKAPFPYDVEEVEYADPITHLHYGATITRPQDQGLHPTVLLITGSGAQDRDETIFGHKPFAVIADYLTRRGIVVMRVDDRGVGKSTGDFQNSTTADFAADVNSSLNYLKTRSGVDPQNLVLMGHSEGGMIAPMVASKRKDIRSIILLAGPGEKISELMAEQNAAILNSAGINKDAVQSFKSIYPTLIQSFNDSKTREEAERKMNQVLDQWKQSAQKNWILATTGIHDDSSQKKYVDAMNQTMFNPWFRYFLRFDPKPYLESLQCSVLALNGEKDLQVVADSNLEGIRKALEKSKSKKFIVRKIPQLNHLFQTCKKCTIQEYGQLEETFSPDVLTLIGDWITMQASRGYN